MNTAHGTTLGPIGITPLELNTDYHIFVYNFNVCTKLKQFLILGVNFAQRYRIGIDWDMYGTLFLRWEGKKIATSMKMTNSGQQMLAFLETPSGKPQETGKKLCLMSNHTVTIPPYHISIIPLKSINYKLSSNIKPNTLRDSRKPFSVNWTTRLDSNTNVNGQSNVSKA